MDTKRRIASVVALISIGGLALSACADSDNGDAEGQTVADETQAEANGGDVDAGESQDDADDADESDPAGTITLDGEDLNLGIIRCGQVGEDDTWRVHAEHDAGEVQMDQGSEGGGSAIFRFDDDRRDLSNTGGTEEIPIEVGEQGATGDTVVSNSDEEYSASINITC